MKYNEIITKSVELLQRIEKMGVGVEGGGPVEHQTGAFGNVEPEETDEETEYTPKDISSEKQIISLLIICPRPPNTVEISGKISAYPPYMYLGAVAHL